MIHVEMTALNSTLVHLGSSDETVQLASDTISMVKLDPVACVFHSPLEDRLLTLIENASLQLEGCLSRDEVVAAAGDLSQTLIQLSQHYNAHHIYERAYRVMKLSRAIDTLH